MTEQAYEPTLERLKAKIAEAEAMANRWRRSQEASREHQRLRDQRTILEYAVPDFAAPLRRLKQEHDEAVAKVTNDQDLTDEARTRRLDELNRSHREEARRELEVVRDRMNSYLSRYRAIAKVNDEPTDEIRYSRLEREYKAKVEAGRIPDLQSYWDAIESGDADLVRVYETYGPLHIEDIARRDELVAEIEKQRQHRLTPEQKLARQRIRELEAKTDDFEMGLRTGAFGREGLEVARGTGDDGEVQSDE